MVENGPQHPQKGTDSTGHSSANKRKCPPHNFGERSPPFIQNVDTGRINVKYRGKMGKT